LGIGHAEVLAGTTAGLAPAVAQESGQSAPSK
jgi:hypothetical protein